MNTHRDRLQRIALWSVAAPVLLLGLSASPAGACSVPPLDLYHPAQDLVRSTENIVLARATDAAAVPGSKIKQFDFTFVTIRSIKGEGPRTFVKRGFRPEDVQGPEDFRAHQAPEFWAFYVGNTIQPGDCVAYGLFTVGEQYLIFLRPSTHIRSFENVRSDNDLWFQVVDLLVRRPDRE